MGDSMGDSPQGPSEPLVIHICNQSCMEMYRHEPQEEIDLEEPDGRCPVHDRPCEYGCEMECFLDDLSPEEMAQSEVEASNSPESLEAR